MSLRWILPFIFVFSTAHALNGVVKPEWKNGDTECPKASATDRYIDVPVFHDLKSMARVERIPNLNLFEKLQSEYKNKKIRIYYETFRPWDPAKKLLLVIPGGPGQTHADLHPLVDLFAKSGPLLREFNVIAMDHRGVGCSRPLFPDNEPAPALMMRQAASDIEMIRQALVGENGQISVWGYSYGSILAQTYGLLYPDHIERFFIGGVASEMNQFHLAGVQLEALAFSAVGQAERENFAKLTLAAPEIQTAFLTWTIAQLYSYKGRVVDIPAKLAEVCAKLAAGNKNGVVEDLTPATKVLPWMTRSLACLEIFPTATIYPDEFPIFKDFNVCTEFKGSYDYFNYTPLLKQFNFRAMVYGGAFDHVTLSQNAVAVAREIPGSFLYIDKYLGHEFSGKLDCMAKLTTEFLLGATNEELSVVAQSSACMAVPSLLR